MRKPFIFNDPIDSNKVRKKGAQHVHKRLRLGSYHFEQITFSCYAVEWRVGFVSKKKAFSLEDSFSSVVVIGCVAKHNRTSFFYDIARAQCISLQALSSVLQFSLFCICSALASLPLSSCRSAGVSARFSRTPSWFQVKNVEYSLLKWIVVAWLEGKLSWWRCHRCFSDGMNAFRRKMEKKMHRSFSILNNSQQHLSFHSTILPLFARTQTNYKVLHKIDADTNC